MSERIRELAEQCVGDRPYNNSFDYEKFAELIIQEYIGKKEWVGLTDEEVSYCRYAATFCDELDTAYMAELIEQALKEKNT
jgi:hypothetical protein